VAALCAELQGVFDVPPQRCEADVLGFLQKLEAKGLLRVVD
jgi:predicted deacylase